jgi:hypothetical protein
MIRRMLRSLIRVRCVLLRPCYNGPSNLSRVSSGGSGGAISKPGKGGLGSHTCHDSASIPPVERSISGNGFVVV